MLPDTEIMEHILLDTNYLLRIFVREDEKMHRIVRELLLRADEGKVQIKVLDFVLCEVEYILRKKLNIDRAMIAEMYMQLFQTSFEFQNMAVTHYAIRTYTDSTLDIADCFLLAYAKLGGYTLATFDKKLILRMKKT